MKQLFTIFCLCFSLCLSAQDVEEIQTPVLSKVTASWCPNCGSWGWTFMEDIMEDNEDKAIILNLHFSGDLVNPVSDAMAENFQAFGQPIFILNNTNQSVNSSNAAAKRQEVKMMVESMSAESPLANTGIVSNLTGNELDLSIKAKFFENTTGNYYVGVYIVEDDVINFQSGQGANASHPNVVRDATTDDWFGTAISETDIQAGAEFSFIQSYTIPNAYDLDNISVVAILWKENNGIYEYINGTKLDELSLPVNVYDQERFYQGARVEVAPTLSRGQSQINLELLMTQEIQISLFNSAGQLVKQVAAGTYPAGAYPFNVTYPSAGIYMITIQTETGMETIPVEVIK